MAGPRFNEPIEPMTLANMRANGVRSLDVSCWQCHHKAILSAERWPDDVPVPAPGSQPKDVRASKSTWRIKEGRRAGGAGEADSTFIRLTYPFATVSERRGAKHEN